MPLTVRSASYRRQLHRGRRHNHHHRRTGARRFNPSIQFVTSKPHAVIRPEFGQRGRVFDMVAPVPMSCLARTRSPARIPQPLLDLASKRPAAMPTPTSCAKATRSRSGSIAGWPQRQSRRRPRQELRSAARLVPAERSVEGCAGRERLRRRLSVGHRPSQPEARRVDPAGHDALVVARSSGVDRSQRRGRTVVQYAEEGGRVNPPHLRGLHDAITRRVSRRTLGGSHPARACAASRG